MKPTIKHILKLVIVCALLSGILPSCATQNLFQSNKSQSIATDSSLWEQSAPHTLQPDDKISVSIWNHDDLSVGSIFGIYNSNEVYGKWVLLDQSGNVKLPKIDTINLLGLSAIEAAEKLKIRYAAFIINPIIVVKILNREVTILGEVLTPGTYLLEKEHNSLFEILGRAGGLNFYANKKSVKFIRNDIEYLLDLTKMEDFTINNLNLQSGDIIYIPTKKGKTLDKKAPTLIPFASAATTIAILISLFAK